MRDDLKVTSSDKFRRSISQKIKASVINPKLKQLTRSDNFNFSESVAVTDALISSIGEGLIIVNEYGEITNINQPALDILGYSLKDLAGKWLPQVLPSYDKSGNIIPPEERPLFQSLLTGRSVAENLNYMRKNGELVPVFSTSSPYMMGKKPLGAIIVFRDISKEIQIERAKDEFVSIASHQLRTPLTSIRFFAELLKDPYYGKLNKKQLNYLEKISFSTERMIGLVSDLLNISRLNLGQLQIKPVPTNINNLVQNQIIELTPQAKNSDVVVSFSTQLSKNETIPLDRTLFAQVVHNLISNAIRYSHTSQTGKVYVELSRNKKHYTLSIADNGIGIPKAAENRVYERFYRADNAVQTNSDGTGLGLYLVKVIVESSGGKIRHESRVNKGTTFFLEIPTSGMVASEVSSSL